MDTEENKSKTKVEQNGLREGVWQTEGVWKQAIRERALCEALDGY
jgi:hypothetical protein